MNKNVLVGVGKAEKRYGICRSPLLMSKTPWSRSSSVPSDRIPPRTPTTGTTGRNKGKGKPNNPSKSKEVLKLECLVEGLRTWTTGADPKGGCFCLGELQASFSFQTPLNFDPAREHGLSKYTPICVQCGLVLCSLHDVFYPCPHCASPLTSPTSREALIGRLTSEISEALAREAEQRERERQELQKAAGAFPALTSSSADHQPATGKFAPRKVLSLNPQTRAVTVTSYKPTPARGPSAAEVKKETKFRVPPPPKEVDYVRNKPMEGRRWQNLRDGCMAYVPPPTQSTPKASRSDQRKKKERGS